MLAPRVRTVVFARRTASDCRGDAMSEAGSDRQPRAEGHQAVHQPEALRHRREPVRDPRRDRRDGEAGRRGEDPRQPHQGRPHLRHPGADRLRGREEEEPDAAGGAARDHPPPRRVASTSSSAPRSAPGSPPSSEEAGQRIDKMLGPRGRRRRPRPGRTCSSSRRSAVEAWQAKIDERVKTGVENVVGNLPALGRDLAALVQRIEQLEKKLDALEQQEVAQRAARIDGLGHRPAASSPRGSRARTPRSSCRGSAPRRWRR